MNRDLRTRAWRFVRRLVARPQPSRRVRVTVAIAAFTAIGVTGALDYAAGPDVSLAVVFLLPVTIGTITVGTVAGLALAAESSAVWLLANSFLYERPTSLGVQTWIGLLRFVILAVVVALLAGFRAALDEARESEQRSREFLANAAHQLRTPIAGIRTSAEALLAEGGSPLQEPILANLAGESARVGRLVASLLRIARLDQGECVEGAPTDIEALCRSEVERVSAQAPTLQVDFAVVGATPPRLVLNADPTREALSNLLDNARRHASSSISVRLAVSDRMVEVTVRDDGPGLPPGSEDHAFGRFVSLDGRGGAGLGLAIARGFAESQGGQLEYREGAFVLSLPSVVAGRRAVTGPR